MHKEDEINETYHNNHQNRAVTNRRTSNLLVTVQLTRDNGVQAIDNWFNGHYFVTVMAITQGILSMIDYYFCAEIRRLNPIFKLGEYVEVIHANVRLPMFILRHVQK